MNTPTIPPAAKQIIEELLNPRTFGRKNDNGNYFFPMCRKARVNRLYKTYGILFPMDIPEPYLSQYLQSINEQANEITTKRQEAG